MTTSRLVAEQLGNENAWDSTHFIEKLIIHHLRNDLIKAYWICDGTEIKPEEYFFNIGQDPGPKEFCYRTVIVRLP